MNGIYQLLMMMVRLFIVLIISTLITVAVAPNTKFCSPVCGTRCNGNQNGNCDKSCPDGAWQVSGNTCAPRTSLGWKFFDTSPDYNGGTLTIAGATSTTVACNNMNYFGFVNPSTTIITVSSPGITVPYFAMKVYFAIIAIDVNCWRRNGGGGGGSSGSCGSGPNPLIQTNFNDPQGLAAANISSSPNPYSTSTVSNNPTRTDYCGSVNNFREYYWRVALTYPSFTTQNQTLQWNITCTEATNTSALWGIRQFLIIIQSCNIACIECYGPLATQCTVCATNYWLSNNTCSLSCLSHFGQANNFICIYCDLRCTACYMEMDNCSACTASGNWSAFLSTTTNPNYPTCINPCPQYYFGNKLTRTCDLCNTGCETCINSATYCTSCINGSYYWTGWACYNPCPPQYFIDPNATNCTRCSPFCSVCDVTSTNCTECTLSGQFKAFLQNTTNLYGNCTRVCATGFYGETYGGVGPNICLACNVNCSICTGNPTPCTQCIPGFYLFYPNCSDTCPNGSIAFNSSGLGLCLNCEAVCVDLTIKMYFPSVVNDKIYIDMIFNQNLNYSSFDQVAFQNITISSEHIQYTSDMFTFTYTNISASAYRITIEPKTYIFLYNATFTVLTKSQPVPVDVSLANMRFKPTNYLKTASLTWFLIKGPPFSSFQIGIMNALSKLSTKTNKFLTHPYVQEIKKTGVFALLFSGAQITSCSMLSNQIQSQNLYEGVRVFAIFVFFDAPPYQQISDKTKRFVTPTVQDRIRSSQQIVGLSPPRGLFSTDKMYWRFQRTGQTSFFIYDVYMPMFLIMLCWAGMILAYCSTKKRWYISYSSSLYSAVHKIHQMSMMYITMASIVQFIYFQPTSSQRIISAIVCIVFNVYFVFYQLYIYQDMIKYPLAQIGNKYYDYFVLRYGFFLKNIRFEQYDPHQEWTPKHWFRPYNFHVLSYYKKFLMIIALPLFYSVLYAQMGILMFLQLLQLIRVWVVWPFVSNSRNIFRLTLEFSLFLFFMINTIQISVLQTIMESDTDGLQTSTKLFYGIGWAGFAFCMYFNLGHICIGVYDLCISLKKSNRAKMDKARKVFYASKINEYQKDNESSSRVLVNRWVKLGNLNDKAYGELPEVNIRIQFYQFKKVGNKFELRIKKITSLKMKKELKKLRRSNNTTAGGKIQKELILSQSKNTRLFSIIQDAYKQFQGPHVQTIRIKTFLNVWQKDYEEGQDIPFDRNMMFQRVELISYDNQVKQVKLQALLEDFPLNQAVINHAI